MDQSVTSTFALFFLSPFLLTSVLLGGGGGFDVTDFSFAAAAVASAADVPDATFQKWRHVATDFLCSSRIARNRVIAFGLRSQSWPQLRIPTSSPVYTFLCLLEHSEFVLVKAVTMT